MTRRSTGEKAAFPWRSLPSHSLVCAPTAGNIAAFIENYNKDLNSLYNCIYYNITNSKGERCVLRHGLSRPQQHTLTSLSRPDPLHTMPLAIILPLYLVDRRGFATTTLLVLLLHERAHRAHTKLLYGNRNCSARTCTTRNLNRC